MLENIPLASARGAEETKEQDGPYAQVWKVHAKDGQFNISLLYVLHFRWLSAWQSVPVEMSPRIFADLSLGEDLVWGRLLDHN